jgi:enterochelin esterase-like enzyme
MKKKIYQVIFLFFTFFTSILGFSQPNESKLEHFEIYSKSLEELRELTVYLPANFNSENHYNVIFCTDGQLINEQYKHKLDSIISNKIVSPFVIIGVHSNEKPVNSYSEYRNYEYNEGWKSDDPDLNTRFERHKNFFVNEVDTSIREELNLKISGKYFYGVSNGAGFGVSLSKFYPELFSKYILYSGTAVYKNYKKIKWNPKNYPFLIIRYGDQELEPFIVGNKELSKHLTKKHYKHLCESYHGGYDRAAWMEWFIKDIQKLN